MDLNTDNPDFDALLPEWAERRSEGCYMEAGAQLATRDGRFCGNAYVDKVEPHHLLDQVAVVERAFYPPVYVLKIDQARRNRGVESDSAE